MGCMNKRVFMNHFSSDNGVCMWSLDIRANKRMDSSYVHVESLFPLLRLLNLVAHMSGLVSSPS